jgi:hypothetical protein
MVSNERESQPYMSISYPYKHYTEREREREREKLLSTAAYVRNLAFLYALYSSKKKKNKSI